MKSRHFRLLKPTLAFVCMCALAGCASSAGDISSGIKNPAAAKAYMGLKAYSMLVIERNGAAVVIAPGIAVTNAHNANLLNADDILAQSTNYDLLFFRETDTPPAQLGVLRKGEKVIAYGQGARDELREAAGEIRDVAQRTEARCATCAVQAAVTYDANAGRGFSGGPVIDAASGEVVAITFGFLPQQGTNGGPLMFAYGMPTVLAEMNRLGVAKLAANRP